MHLHAVISNENIFCYVNTQTILALHHKYFIVGKSEDEMVLRYYKKAELTSKINTFTNPSNNVY